MAELRSHDVDRLFLQALMTRRVVSEDLLKQLFIRSKAAVLSVDADVQVMHDNDWLPFLARVKASLDKLDLNIAKTVNEETGQGVYALVNTAGDDISKLATEYPAEHIIYFRHIVEQIMTAPRQAFSISSMAALLEVQSLPDPVKKKVGKVQAQALLNSFVARGWLSYGRRGRYSLAARSLMELRKYLTDTFEEDSLFECTSCDGFVLKGLRCTGQEGKCPHKIHKPCYAKLGNNARKCPTCSAPWPDAGAMKEVGEGAVRDGDRETRRKIRRGGSQEEDREEAGDGQEDVDMDGAEDTQNGKKKQRKERKPKKEGKKSTGKKAREEVEDEDEEVESEAVESQEDVEEEPEPGMDEESDEPSKTRRKSRR